MIFSLDPNLIDQKYINMYVRVYMFNSNHRAGKVGVCLDNLFKIDLSKDVVETNNECDGKSTNRN